MYNKYQHRNRKDEQVTRCLTTKWKVLNFLAKYHWKT